MSFRRGEIVLADILYSDRSGSKRRPVLVVSTAAAPFLHPVREPLHPGLAIHHPQPRPSVRRTLATGCRLLESSARVTVGVRLECGEDSVRLR